MFRFFKFRLPVRKFKNSSSTETPVGPGRPSRAWVRTDYNLASVSSLAKDGRTGGLGTLVCERTSRRDVTGRKHLSALPGPVGRQVLPPSLLVRQWAQKKDRLPPAVRPVLPPRRKDGRFGALSARARERVSKFQAHGAVCSPSIVLITVAHSGFLPGPHPTLWLLVLFIRIC